ncbi:g5889 [Coccomyxa elongata]
MTCAPELEHAEDDDLHFSNHMLAGAVAGTLEHTLMFPVDTVKTRMQALAHPGQRLHGVATFRAVQAVLRREGIRGLYGGVAAAGLGAGPSHAVHFAVYEAAKRWLGSSAENGFAGAALSGATATVVSDACMTPFDVIKQRLQVAHSPYRGFLDCLRRTVQQDGVAALFKSYPTTLLMNIPFMAIYFASYEGAKQALIDYAGGEETLLIQGVAGGVAGGAAAASTTPLDVVKTRLQLEGVSSPVRYMSMNVASTLRHIAAAEGHRALWAGLRPRVLFHVPAAAITWSSYETMKLLLRDRSLTAV